MAEEAWRGADDPDDNERYEPEDEYDLDAEDRFELEQGRWYRVGQELTKARRRLGLSKREAARRADLSDGAWRHLEAGIKVTNKVHILPNPRPENLISAARAVELNPAVLFTIAERHLPEDMLYNGPSHPEKVVTPDGRDVTLAGLSDKDVALVIQLVERLRNDGSQGAS